MTHALVSTRRHASAFGKATLGAAVATALGFVALGTMAQEGTDAPQSVAAPVPQLSAAQLERAFWICDHAATKRPVDAGSAVVCTMVTEQLKERKFDGDFDALVTWWRRNKTTEHQGLEADYAASTARPAGSIIAQ